MRNLWPNKSLGTRLTTTAMACAATVLLAGCNCCTSPEGACLNTLNEIDGAKEAWANEQHKTTKDTPTLEDLRRYFAIPVPMKCPSGGTYTIGRIGEPPNCSVPEHATLWQDFLKKQSQR
jgi:hypothetical protein